MSNWDSFVTKELHESSLVRKGFRLLGHSSSSPCCVNDGLEYPIDIGEFANHHFIDVAEISRPLGIHRLNEQAACFLSRKSPLKL